MGSPLAILVLVLIVLLIGALVLWGTGTFKSAEAGEVEPEDVEAGRALRYDVPRGQDPAVVLVALEHAGVEAWPDPHRPGRAIVIPCEGHRDVRDRARAAIEGARSTSLDGPPTLDPRPVRFWGEA